jgi:hypothetical protein
MQVMMANYRAMEITQAGTQTDIRDERYRTEPDIGTYDI